MSSIDVSRRTEITLEFEGVDISADINKYLLNFEYTDNEEDKTDDLTLTLDDRDNYWLGSWLDENEESDKSAENYKVGDFVTVTGRPQYSSSGNGTPGNKLTNYKGKVTKTNYKSGIKYPIHVDKKGWFEESQLTKDGNSYTGISGKGSIIRAMIIQRNKLTDGKDSILDCGYFEIDSIDGSGPPSKVTLRATSLPYSSSIRYVLKNRVWENISIHTIAMDIAKQNNMECKFYSGFNKWFERKEQVNMSDIAFLRELCLETGISLKVSSKMIILFNAYEFETKETIRTIKKYESDILSYKFSTNFNDTAYDCCHVSYTNPQTKKTIEYTYTPRENSKKSKSEKNILEINEKVNNKEEARQIAMKRLREKNKNEFKAEFNLIGDTCLVAGVTVQAEGFGKIFDGKYIVESAVHKPTDGYTVNINLRKVLEGY